MRYEVLLAAVVAAFVAGLGVWGLLEFPRHADAAQPGAASACRLSDPDLPVISLGTESVVAR